MSQKQPKILLITPFVLYARQPSIGIAYLCSYLRSKGFEVKAWDLNTEILIPNDGDDCFWSQEENCKNFFLRNKILFDSFVKRIMDYGPQIIGFTTWSTTKFFSLELARMIKENDKNILIILGGYGCNINEEKLISNPFVDIVVRGEGENALLDIIKQYADKGKIEFGQGMLIKNNGSIINCGGRQEISDLDSLPFPDFSDFQLEKYVFKHHIPLLFSRGCSWRCNFCTVFHSWTNFRKRSPENIFKEILYRLKEYPMLKQFELCDSAFNQDINLVSKLCDLIIAEGLQVRFSGLSQIRPEMDFGLLKKMRKAGFILCNYGVESGSQKVLQAMGKRYSPEEAERVIKDTHNAGIDVVLNFVIGFPGETEGDFYGTLKFIERIKDFVSNIAPGHECDIEHSNIRAYPEKFGVIYSKDRINLWETVDGMLNFKERNKRKRIFDKFVAELNIPLKCGMTDRKDKEK